MNKAVYALLLLIFLSGCARPTEPRDPFEDYYYDYSSSLSDLSESVVDTAGSFDLIIERNTNHGYMEAIIAKAEACYPPEYLIVEPEDRDRLDIPPGEALWWGGSWGGVRIPFAITASAVTYYMNLIQLYQDGKFEEAGTGENISALFRYKASATYYNGFIYDNRNYGNVIVVQQELSWSNYCGFVCALGFFRVRMVVFDAQDGTLLAIIGDGPGMIAVS